MFSLLLKDLISDFYLINIDYRKIPQCSDTRKIAVIILKFEQSGYTIGQWVQKMPMEWHVDPNQTVQEQSDLSLFAQTCPSENLGTLR